MSEENNKMVPPIIPPAPSFPAMIPPVPVPVVAPEEAARANAREMNKPDERSLSQKVSEWFQGKNSYEQRVDFFAEGAGYQLNMMGVKADLDNNGKFSQDEINAAIAGLPNRAQQSGKGGRE